jgi:hypothetical protein
MTKQLKLMTMVVIILVCIPFIWESRGCKTFRMLFLTESYSLYNSGAGLPLKHFICDGVSESSLFNAIGPEDGEMYKDSVLPRSVKVKIISKIDLPGKIITYGSSRGSDLKSSYLYVIYQDKQKYYLAHIEEKYRESYTLLGTSEVGGSNLLGIHYKYNYLYIQSDDLKEIYVCNVNGGLLKEYDLQKPSITTIIDYDDQERPIFLAFDGQRLFTFKDGETTEVMTLDTDNGISNACFFEQQKIDIPFLLPEYDVNEPIPLEKRSFDLVFYDGQYLHALSLTNKKTAFKIKIDGLKPGVITMNYIVAPYKEGICLIDRDTREITNLLKSNEEFRLLDHGGSMDETLSDMFFTSYSKGKSAIKGWRFGKQKNQIKGIIFPTVNDKINSMRGYGYLIFYGDNGIYYTTEMYPSWNDVYW